MLSSTSCGFRSTISSIWFDVSCIEIPPRLSTLNPSPWIRHWCASKLKFYFFYLINFNKLLNKWTKTINASCLSPLTELTNHMRTHSVCLSTAPKLEKYVTCPRSISKNQTFSAWNLLCICHVSYKRQDFEWFFLSHVCINVFKRVGNWINIVLKKSSLYSYNCLTYIFFLCDMNNEIVWRQS